MLSTTCRRILLKNPIVSPARFISIYEWENDDNVYINQGRTNAEQKSLWKQDPLPISFEDISRAHFNIRSGGNNYDAYLGLRVVI